MVLANSTDAAEESNSREDSNSFDASGKSPKGPSVVLVVEDDADVLMTLDAMLDQIGYRTRCVSNGIQALEVLKEDALKEISFIVSDYDMPEMTGLEFFNSLKNMMGSSIPFILMSGKLEKTDLVQYMNIGIDGVLCKPFTSDALAFEINEAFIRNTRKNLKKMA